MCPLPGACGSVPSTLPGVTLAAKPLITFFNLLDTLNNYYYTRSVQKSTFITKSLPVAEDHAWTQKLANHYPEPSPAGEGLGVTQQGRMRTGEAEVRAGLEVPQDRELETWRT